MELKKFTKEFGFEFTNLKLLETALSHKSYTQEVKTESDNERLEFLGDAVIDLALSELLMEVFPADSEGSLSKKRASLVNERLLAEMAVSKKLGQHLKLGKGEKQSKGNEKSRILASAYEAVIGAAFLDQGYDRTKELVREHFMGLVRDQEFEDLDFKTRLQEVTQKIFKSAPIYKVVSEEGPGHQKLFSVKLFVKEKECAQASGPSKKQAEQKAAEIALKKLTGESL
jgi:ribonuclease III